MTASTALPSLHDPLAEPSSKQNVDCKIHRIVQQQDCVGQVEHRNFILRQEVVVAIRDVGGEIETSFNDVWSTGEGVQHDGGN